MADHLTYTLGGAGYRAHKIVPYGPVQARREEAWRESVLEGA